MMIEAKEEPTGRLVVRRRARTPGAKNAWLVQGIKLGSTQAHRRGAAEVDSREEPVRWFITSLSARQYTEERVFVQSMEVGMDSGAAVRKIVQLEEGLKRKKKEESVGVPLNKNKAALMNSAKKSGGE